MTPQDASTTAADQVLTCTSPKAFLQRLADALRYGLTWYVQGNVNAEKWPRVEAKLRGRYPTLNRDRKHLARERKAGRPAVRLFALAPKGRAGGQVEFVLAAAAPVAGDGEVWRDAAADRIRVWQYEAVRQTRPGSATPAWTWRLQKARYAALRAEVVERVRKHHDDALAALGASARLWAGFAPVRKQHRALRLLVEGEWKRSRAWGTKPPPWPRLGYVRRLKNR